MVLTIYGESLNGEPANSLFARAVVVVDDRGFVWWHHFLYNGIQRKEFSYTTLAALIWRTRGPVKVDAALVFVEKFPRQIKHILGRKNNASDRLCLGAVILGFQLDNGRVIFLLYFKDRVSQLPIFWRNWAFGVLGWSFYEPTTLWGLVFLFRFVWDIVDVVIAVRTQSLEDFVDHIISQLGLVHFTGLRFGPRLPEK